MGIKIRKLSRALGAEVTTLRGLGTGRRYEAPPHMRNMTTTFTL